MTREEYKEYTAKVMEEEKQKHYEEEEKIKTELRFKKKLLPIWIKLSKKHSAAYANLWLYAMGKLEIIEFDEEVEEIYDGLELDWMLTIDETGMPKAPTLKQLLDRDVSSLYTRDNLLIRDVY